MCNKTTSFLRNFLYRLHPKNITFQLLYVILPVIITFLLDKKYTLNSVDFSIKLDTYYYILDGYIKAFVFLTSLILAFSYFIYREQKSISLRHYNFDVLFYYFTFSIPGLIIVIFLRINPTVIHHQTVQLFPVDFFKVVFLLLTISLAIIYIIITIPHLLNKLDLKSQLKLSTQKIHKITRDLYYSQNKTLEKQLLQKVHIHFESIFQILEYSIKNKMDRTLKYGSNKLSRLLHTIMDDAPREEADVYVKKLNEKYDEDFRSQYKTIIKHLGELISEMIVVNKKDEIDNTFSMLGQLEPNNVPNLYPTYLKAIERISIQSIASSSYLFEKSLALLEKPHKKDNNLLSNAVGYILVYQSILKKVCEKNDVIKTTTISYSLDNFIRPLKITETNKFHDHSHKRIDRLKKSIADSQRNIFESNTSAEILQEVSLFVLLENTLKSIELGNYGVTGLLIKRISTDFNSQTINNVLDRFVKNNASFRQSFKDLPKNYIFNDLVTDFNFNNRSIEYCMQKLLFLLLGQQRFIFYKNITFTEFFKSNGYNIQTIFNQYFNFNHLNYITMKVMAVGNRYGLVYFDDQSFMKKFINNLGIYNPNLYDDN